MWASTRASTPVLLECDSCFGNVKIVVAGSAQASQQVLRFSRQLLFDKRKGLCILSFNHRKRSKRSSSINRATNPKLTQPIRATILFFGICVRLPTYIRDRQNTIREPRRSYRRVRHCFRWLALHRIPCFTLTKSSETLHSPATSVSTCSYDQVNSQAATSSNLIKVAPAIWHGGFAIAFHSI